MKVRTVWNPEWDPLDSCQGALIVFRSVHEVESAQKNEKVVFVAVPGERTVDLTPGDWTVTGTNKTCTALPAVVSLEEKGGAVTLELRPKGYLVGSFVAGDGLPAPRDVGVRLFALGKAGIPPSMVCEVPCDVDANGAIRCVAPSGRWDLRFSSPGRSGSYRWAVEVKPRQETSVANIRLVPGASVTGFVIAGRGIELPPGLEVELVPRGLETAQRGERVRFREVLADRVPVDDAGFFQLPGVQPGEYSIAARAGGLAATPVPLTVYEDREARLINPLEVSALASVSFFLEPPVEEAGDPWSLTLLSVDPYTSQASVVAQGAADLGGVFEVAAIAPGEYRLKVTSASGDDVYGEIVHVESGDTVHSIEIAQLLISGVVRLGDQPLAGASVYFGGKRGAESVLARTDRDGRYRATLPGAGRYPVEIEADRPPVRKKIAAVEIEAPKGNRPVTLDLELPDTRLIGRVVDESGREAENALVYIAPMEGAFAQVVTARAVAGEGFEVRGVDAGLVQLHAETRTSRSDAMLVRLTADDEHEVELELHELLTVTGSVMIDGRPAAGALVNLQPTHVPFPGNDVIADGEGRFRDDRLPKGTTAVFATVGVPGTVLWVGHMPVSEDQPSPIRLTSSAGELRVRMPEGGWQRTNDWSPFFLYNGIPIAEAKLERWAALAGREDNGPHLLVAPGMAPGNYSACRVPNAKLSLWRLGLGEDLDLCGQGPLPSFGQLEVESPAW